jgi:hypothetical protein
VRFGGQGLARVELLYRNAVGLELLAPLPPGITMTDIVQAVLNSEAAESESKS